MVVSTEICILKKMFQQQVTEDISDVVKYGLTKVQYDSFIKVHF